MSGQSKPPGERQARVPRTQRWGLVLDLGMRMGLSVVIGIGGGVLLDNWAHTSPLFTLLGVVVGVGAAMYSIWDVARTGMRPR